MTIRRFFVLVTFLLGSTLFVSAGSIPAGSHASVRINTTLSSASAHKEESWSGTLTNDIRSGGNIVAHAGDPVRGKVTYVKSSGRLHNPGILSLRLSSIHGEIVYSSRVSRKGKSHTTSNVAKIGGGTAGGALIGGLIGVGKGAALVAGTTASGGTGGSVPTRRTAVPIPVATGLTLSTTWSHRTLRLR